MPHEMDGHTPHIKNHSNVNSLIQILLHSLFGSTEIMAEVAGSQRPSIRVVLFASSTVSCRSSVVGSNVFIFNDVRISGGSVFIVVVGGGAVCQLEKNAHLAAQVFLCAIQRSEGLLLWLSMGTQHHQAKKAKGF